MAALLLSTNPAGAEERKTVPTTPITLDESGLPIVPVTLHSMKNWNVVRTFRFLLDTGSSACLVDQSVPSEFFWDEPYLDSSVEDLAKQVMGAQSVILKRVEVGHVSRDGIMAARMDLRTQIGRFQDQPVDGVLGMSFLRGTRFLLDPKAGRLVWWENHFSSGAMLPMTDGPDGPVLKLRLGTQETSALVDTGSNGGIALPMDLLPKGDGHAAEAIGLSGVLVSGSEVVVARLEAGSSAWSNLPVAFQGTGKIGGIGVGVLLAAPVCFDFITNHLSFSLDATGNLPIRRQISRSLPIIWEGQGGTRRLVVLLVKPGSAMEKAGCKMGDELIQVGELQGAALTRRSVQDLVATGARHVWVVRRKGQEVKLQFGLT
jgi:predicted aspartyl protease